MSVLTTNLSPETLREAVITRQHFGFAQCFNYHVGRFTGPDAISFLHNRLSNDVLALKPGQGQRNAVLDRQGNIQGIMDLYRAEDSVWLMLDTAEAVNAVDQIEKYHILEQFQRTDQTQTNVVWALQGPHSTPFLQTILSDGVKLPHNDFDWVQLSALGVPITLIRRSLLGDDGFLLLVPSEQAAQFQQAFTSACLQGKGTPISPLCWEALRIEAGQPCFGKDYDFETLLPETGLEREAVSYSKGCYLGQETIARVKTYGMLQRALVGLLFPPELDSLPPTGQDCLIGGKVVGQLTSVAFSPTLKRPVALAYLGKKERIPGKVLALEIAGQSYEAEVALLPFYTLTPSTNSGASLLAEGLRLFSEGQEEEAIQKLRQALAKQPDLLAAYEALGVILSRHEQYDEAIALMNQLLTLDPDHVLAHTNLSVFYMKLGDKEKAEDEKAKATIAAFRQKAKEAGLTVDFEAERLKKEQATRERIAMFQEALKFNPDDPLGNFGLGSAYLELKQFEQAIEPFQKTLKAQPKHSVAYASLAKCLAATGQCADAEAILHKGIEVAAAKGDLMPLKAMQAHLEELSAVG